MIAQEKELLASVRTALPQARRVLAFAPHPDDEVFGCGGILARMAAAKVQVTVIIATDGALGGAAEDHNTLGQVRMAESRAAAQVLGIPEPLFWGLPDRGLVYGETLIMRLMAAVSTIDADCVLLPSPIELHPDHQALALAGTEALRRLGGDRRIIFYEINTPLQTPNILLDISELAERKLAAMRCFVSQLKEQPYDLRMEGLNRFRSYFLGPQAVAAEAFLLTTPAALSAGPAVLFEGAPAHRQRLGFSVSSEHIPLVSIIVRSMDRPTLGRALDSLALQTWPNVEVVVVNAKGGRHSLLPEQCGGFPLRLINRDGPPLGRSQAANAGLDACRGMYLGFLDDDDTLDPGHIHHLVAALGSGSGGALAYACVRGVNDDLAEPALIAEFRSPGVTFAELLFGNLLPIHSVLFSQKLRAQGARFDETLNLYEDWDFWLQLTRQTTPVFVDRISATYYANGTSRVGLGANVNDVAKQQAKERLAEKWLQLLTPQEFVALGGLYHHTLLQVATGCASVADRDRQLAEKEQQLAEKDQQIAGLYASRSWRITAPIRRCGELFRSIRSHQRALADKIRHTGGLGRACLKAFRILSAEGPAGVRGRLHAVHEQALDRNDYSQWVQQYDLRTEEECAGLQARLAQFSTTPLISVVMPVYNPEPCWLIEAIESIRSQIYPHWELCIADDASTNPEIRPILARYATEDTRIKVCYREQNGHISVASNSAIALAAGQWLALFDHDDILPAHALFWVADAINRQPDLQLIYSDEDKIDEQGLRFGPYFKSDFNYQLFLCQNMISHLGVYRADRVRAVGGFRQGLEGSQDYDLALRVIEGLEPWQIGHIPRILYHWRSHRQSTASGNDVKPYAQVAALRAVEEHLQRSAVRATVEPAPQVATHARVRYIVPEPAPLVEIILVCSDQPAAVLRRSVASIVAGTTYPHYLITLAGAKPVEPELLQLFEQWSGDPRIRISPGESVAGYAQLANRAVQASVADLICLLDSNLDVISPDWLGEMVGHALQPGVGAVGARLLYAGGTLQHGGIILGLGGSFGYAHQGCPRAAAGYFGRAVLQQEFSAVSGSCLLVTRQRYLAAGGLEERYLSKEAAAIDFCLKLKEQGLRTLWTPYAELCNRADTDAAHQDPYAADVCYLQRRCGAVLADDPCYSPNLALEATGAGFGLAWPPRVRQLPVV